MANLVDMRRQTEEKIAGQTELCSPEGEDDYPYGLQINLNNETIEKLGIPLPEVGKEVNIVAKANVISVSERSKSEGEADRRVELQITELALSKPADEIDAGKLYPTMSEDSSVRTEV